MDIEVRDKNQEEYRIQALDGNGGYFYTQDSLKLLTHFANKNNIK